MGTVILLMSYKWTAHGKEQITEVRGRVALPNGWSGTKHVKGLESWWLYSHPYSVHPKALEEAS
jgi:hypothetical protein